jgi:predicted nucleic acid-binding protein
MNGKTVFDTCIILDFVNKKAGALDLYALFSGESRFISVITKLELLKYPDITPEEEKRILAFLPDITVLPITEAIERETIEISRNTKLKLPDAIIAATAIVTGAEVVSTDPHFRKCTYPKLRVWVPEGEK